MKNIILLVFFTFFISCSKYSVEKKTSEEILNCDFKNIDSVFENNRPITSFYLDSVIGNNKPNYYFNKTKYFFNKNYFLERSGYDVFKDYQKIYLFYISKNNNYRIRFDYIKKEGELKLNYITLQKNPD